MASVEVVAVATAALAIVGIGADFAAGGAVAVDIGADAVVAALVGAAALATVATFVGTQRSIPEQPKRRQRRLPSKLLRL